MNEIIVPDYKANKTDLIVRYEIASLSGEAFHEFIIKVSQQLNDKGILSKNSKISLFDINQATKEWSAAFHESYFDPGNINQQLSLLSEIFLLHSDLNIKILDIKWTEKLLQAFEGPHQGIKEIQAHFNIHERPLLCGLLKSSHHLSGKEIIEEAYHMWMGGCDIVSESRYHNSRSMHEFEDRLSYVTKEMRNCSKRTEKRKEYIPHISDSSYENIIIKIQKAEKYGLSIISLDEELIGLAGLRSISNQFGKRGIMILSSGIRKSSLDAMIGLRCSRFLGSDLLRLDHILHQDRQRAIEEMNKKHSFPIEKSMPILRIDNLYGDIEDAIKEHGPQIIIESKALIKNHPDGLKEGASTLLLAIEAAAKGVEQTKAASEHPSLKKALQKEQENNNDKSRKKLMTSAAL